MGFHSNDARGVTRRVDPADPLVRTYGAEIGVRSVLVTGAAQHDRRSGGSTSIPSCSSSATPAPPRPTRPSRRYGVEIANYYSPTEWLTFDADYSLLALRAFATTSPRAITFPGRSRTWWPRA